MPTQHSAIDVSSLLSEQKYDEAQFSNMPAWAEELTKGPHSEADEYGIGNFTLQILGRPFHAERFFQFMQNQNLYKLKLYANWNFMQIEIYASWKFMQI